MPEAPVWLNMNSNTAATTGGGQVHLWSVTINKVGATANTLTLTDSVTGKVIAVIDTTIAAAPTRGFFGMRVPGGITATMATGTAADVTIVYS